MLGSHLLPLLLAFAIGQAAAWYYLRSGRFVVGFTATVVLWGALDWWLVARYVLGHDEAALRLPALPIGLNGQAFVSPVTTVTSSNSTPSASAQSCASDVLSPWPDGPTPE